MNKMGYQLQRIAMGILICGAGLGGVQAQSPETIIGQFREAVGGGKSLTAYSAVLRGVEGSDRGATLYRAAAGQFRLETAVSCLCFDGKTYRAREAGPVHAGKAMDAPVATAYPAAFDGAKATAGVTDDNGTPCYRVRVEKEKAEYFLNPRTFLPYKVVRKGAGGREQTEIYADYHNEDGFVLPHYVRSGGKEYVLSDIRVNPELPAGWFACGRAK